MMEPLIVAEDASSRTTLTDLAIDLAARSAGFRRSLPDGVTAITVTVTFIVSFQRAFQK